MIYIENTDKEKSLLIIGSKVEEPDMLNLRFKSPPKQERFVLRPGENYRFKLEDYGDILGIQIL
jgi:hypothetical protein